MTNPTGDALVTVGVAETQHHVTTKTISDAAHLVFDNGCSLLEHGDTKIPLISAHGVKLVPSSAAMREKV